MRFSRLLNRKVWLIAINSTKRGKEENVIGFGNRVCKLFIGVYLFLHRQDAEIFLLHSFED